MGIGLFVVITGVVEDLVSGNYQHNLSLVNMIFSIVSHLSSNIMTSGISFFAIGLSLFSLLDL
jgi:hypothetical protein